MALGLLATAQAGGLDDVQHARVDLLRAQVTFASGSASDAPPLLLRVAQRLEPFDPGLARETYLDAWGAAMRAGGLSTAGDLFDVSRAVRAAPRPSDPPPASDLLLDGLCAARHGWARRRRIDAGACSVRFRSDAIRMEKGLQWSSLAATAAVVLWDVEGWNDVIQVQVELAHDAGALGPLPLALNAQAMALTLCGDLAAAASANAGSIARRLIG